VNFSGTRLKTDTELLRPALELKYGIAQTAFKVRRKVTQTRACSETQSCSDPHFWSSCLPMDARSAF